MFFIGRRTAHFLVIHHPHTNMDFDAVEQWAGNLDL
jgi:hypothetical protein